MSVGIDEAANDGLVPSRPGERLEQLWPQMKMVLVERHEQRGQRRDVFGARSADSDVDVHVFSGSRPGPARAGSKKGIVVEDVSFNEPARYVDVDLETPVKRTIPECIRNVSATRHQTRGKS